LAEEPIAELLCSRVRLPSRVSSEYVVAALAGMAVFVVGFLIVWALLT
jgi:hypothetical protein